MFENFKKLMMIKFERFDLDMMHYFLDNEVMQASTKNFIFKRGMCKKS